MNYLYKLLPILFIAFLISCEEGGGGDDPTPATFTEKLQGTWNMESVKIDGSDVSSDFSGFSITFDAGLNYTITNGGITFPFSSGSLGGNFDDSDVSSKTVFIDGINQNNEATLAFSNNNNTLTLSFTVDTTTLGLGGRGEGLAGNYVFVLNK
jgi:hypothetical protein